MPIGADIAQAARLACEYEFPGPPPRFESFYLTARENFTDLDSLELVGKHWPQDPPPLRKPGATHEEFDDASIKAAEIARKRSARFKSREAFADLMAFSPNFRHVAPGVLPLLAQTTLRESPSGDGYELVCPPEHEAQIVEYGRFFAVFVDFATIACPIKVLGADPTLPFAYLPTLDLGDIREVDYDFLPDATHFLQLEQPEACAAALRQFLAERGFG